MAFKYISLWIYQSISTVWSKFPIIIIAFVPYLVLEFWHDINSGSQFTWKCLKENARDFDITLTIIKSMGIMKMWRKTNQRLYELINKLSYCHL